MSRISTSLICCLPLFISCGDGKRDYLRDDQVETTLSAPMLPPTFAGLAMTSLPYLAAFEEECPVVTELEGGGISLEGDCTTDEGEAWSG